MKVPKRFYTNAIEGADDHVDFYSSAVRTVVSDARKSD